MGEYSQHDLFVTNKKNPRILLLAITPRTVRRLFSAVLQHYVFCTSYVRVGDRNGIRMQINRQIIIAYLPVTTALGKVTLLCVHCAVRIYIYSITVERFRIDFAISFGLINYIFMKNNLFLFRMTHISDYLLRIIDKHSPEYLIYFLKHFKPAMTIIDCNYINI